MAKKINFPLEMEDGHEVRYDLEEYRAHFTLVKAIEHFTSGKLVEWLEYNLYNDEANALEQLDKDATDFPRRLCEILGVEMPETADTEPDVDAIHRTQEKEKVLRQKTSDEKVIANAAKTAFHRGDVVELLKAGEKTIYLCGDAFDIPLGKENVRYIGVLGTPKITIKASAREELANKGITFDNVELPEYLQEKKTEKAKTCEWCETVNLASAKFCNGCGASLDGAKEVTEGDAEKNTVDKEKNPFAAHLLAAKKEWKIPKSQLKTMFVSTFKKDFDYFRGHERFNPNGIDENATFFMVGPNSNVTHDLTNDQKNMALALICGGQYTEDDLIHLRIPEDMTRGWAFTLDSFCVVAGRFSEIIPYGELNFGSRRETLIVGGHEIGCSMAGWGVDDIYIDLYTAEPLFKFLANMKNIFRNR